MANQWLRLWHDMPNDPKWRTISKRSKQPISLVMSTYMHLLVMASLSDERGTVELKIEDLANALDAQVSDIDSIIEAMQGRVIKGNKLMGWSKRQPIKEDGSAERAKAWRVAKKNATSATNATEQQDKDKDKDKDKEIKALSSDEPEKNIAHELFTMSERWQPTNEFADYLIKLGITEQKQEIPEKILQEFVLFWCAKPDIKKTQLQWHHALAQSYQYAINREKHHGKNKRFAKRATGSIQQTASDLSWWNG